MVVSLVLNDIRSFVSRGFQLVRAHIPRGSDPNTPDLGKAIPISASGASGPWRQRAKQRYPRARRGLRQKAARRTLIRAQALPHPHGRVQAWKAGTPAEQKLRRPASGEAGARPCNALHARPTEKPLTTTRAPAPTNLRSCECHGTCLVCAHTPVRTKTTLRQSVDVRERKIERLPKRFKNSPDEYSAQTPTKKRACPRAVSGVKEPSHIMVQTFGSKTQKLLFRGSHRIK